MNRTNVMLQNLLIRASLILSSQRQPLTPPVMVRNTPEHVQWDIIRLAQEKRSKRKLRNLHNLSSMREGKELEAWWYVDRFQGIGGSHCASEKPAGQVDREVDCIGKVTRKNLNDALPPTVVVDQSQAVSLLLNYETPDGKRMANIRHNTCGKVLTVNRDSMAGSGKRCECGVKLKRVGRDYVEVLGGKTNG